MTLEQIERMAMAHFHYSGNCRADWYRLAEKNRKRLIARMRYAVEQGLREAVSA